MRGWFSGVLFGAAGMCVLGLLLGLILIPGKSEEKSASTILVAVDDNPPSFETTEAENAEIAALPEMLAVPEKLFIADAIRLKLSDPTLGRGHHADDLAAVEAFYDAHDGPALWITTAGISPKGQAVLSEITKANNWGLDPGVFIVPPLDYQPTVADDQAATEIAISLAILKYARHARGGRVNVSALSELIDQMPPLRDPTLVLPEIASEETPDAYLTDLHPKHSQFALLRQALLNARADEQTSQNDVEKILVNMERWRWMPEDLGALYVWLNTPEFMMHVVKGGKPLHSEKIVVGKPVYATPVFSANMESIVFNPKWTVPPTIVREDLLPKLRKGGGGWFSGSSNTAVLKEHKLKVLYKGREVNPEKVDWNKVNMAAIRFVQEPGPKNYLGKVKFIYPNKHMVYMHDTIKRGPLKKKVRAEGHHCPRVDNPGKVAAILLAEDKGWEKSKIDQLLNKGRDSSVALDNAVPVHTTYFTAVVDPDGQVKSFSDIYELDGLVAKAISDTGDASQTTASASAPPWKNNREESVAVSTP